MADQNLSTLRINIADLAIRIARRFPSENIIENQAISTALVLLNQADSIADLSPRKSRQLIAQARRLSNLTETDNG